MYVHWLTPPPSLSLSLLPLCLPSLYSQGRRVQYIQNGRSFTLCKITMAVSCLHSHGIIHRDLSSNNILMIARSRAKVTDFGISKLTDVNPRMTPLTQCPGTMVYMSPEALRTPPSYSEKLDIFSLGVLMLQIVTCNFLSTKDPKKTIRDRRLVVIEMPVSELER